MDTLSEQGSFNIEELKETLGLELDEDVGVKFEDNRAIKRRKLC